MARAFTLIDLALVGAAPFVGVLLAVSAGRWIDGWENGRREAAEARQELLQSAGLMELHHKVHAEVGEREWESRVKPDFLSAITRETAVANGDLAPSWRDVVDWTRRNPERARDLMRRAAQRRPELLY